MNNAANTESTTSSTKTALIARLEREAEERLQAALANVPADWDDPWLVTRLGLGRRRP